MSILKGQLKNTLKFEEEMKVSWKYSIILDENKINELHRNKVVNITYESVLALPTVVYFVFSN